jgi:hypothetical protein
MELQNAATEAELKRRGRWDRLHCGTAYKARDIAADH